MAGITEKTWNERRRQVRRFRKQTGARLKALAGQAGMTEAMLSLFENRKTKLSEKAWRRLNVAMQERVRKAEQQITDKASEADKLTKLAQTIHSPTLAEMMEEYTDRYVGLIQPALGELKTDVLNLYEIALRAVREAGEARRQLNFFTKWHAENPADQRARRAEAMVENLGKFIEEHLSTIASGEAAKLAEKEKEFAAMREEYQADLRRIGFKDGEI